jgi:hypothetical protein
MNKHTPGPWHVFKDSSIYSKHADYTLAEMVAGMTVEEWDANARLMAAAPELLEALQSFLNWSDSVYYGEDTRRELVRAKDKARAAIVKATGEQQ